MSTQVVEGALYFGREVGLLNGTDGNAGANTDGTQVEIKSDEDFYVVGSSVGDQWPQRVVTHANLQCGTFFRWAYILDRSGNVGAMLPVTSRASGAPFGKIALPRPYTLQPGDTVQTMTDA